MTDFIATAFLPALVLPAVGWLARGLYDRFRSRRARGVWKPFVTRSATLVVSRFDDFGSFEPSGLVGWGDAVAASMVQTHLATLGGRVPEVVYPKQIGPAERSSNLVLIGGPDANQVTHQVVNRLETSIKFGNIAAREVTIADEVSGRVYAPTIQQRDAIYEGVTGTDYGVIIGRPNPFQGASFVLILAGCFGFGTIAAARVVASSSSSLPEMQLSRSARLECIVKADVLDGNVVRAEVVTFRI